MTCVADSLARSGLLMACAISGRERGGGNGGDSGDGGCGGCDGSNGGGPQGSATGLQTWTLTENWEMQGMNSLIAPDGADSVLIQIRLVTGAFDGAGGYAGIDAVSMTANPAPGALALLGLAGIANRRRRG